MVPVSSVDQVQGYQQDHLLFQEWHSECPFKSKYLREGAYTISQTLSHELLIIGEWVFEVFRQAGLILLQICHYGLVPCVH